jgi:hypothetical protein
MTGFMRAGVVAAGLGLCAAGQQAPLPLVTAHDWKRLHKRARTAAEFRTCAQWCRQQADGYQKQEAQYEADLVALHRRPPNHEGPRYPPTVEDLQTEISQYKGLVQHWRAKAESYDRKAAAAR